MPGMQDITSHVTPPPVGLTDGAVFLCAIPNGSPVLDVHNESPLRVYLGLYGAPASHVIAIPPTCILHDCDLITDLGATEGAITITLRAEAMLGGTPPIDPLSNQIKVFAREDRSGAMGITSLVRNVGSVGLVAQLLQGGGQLYGVIESDDTFGPGGPQLAPSDGASRTLSLAYRDSSGGRQDFIVGNPIDGTATFPLGVKFSGQVDFAFGSSLVMPFTINGVSVVGQSVPLVIASTKDQQVTAKTIQTLAPIQAPLSGHYRVSVSFNLSNSVSGNNITCLVNYTNRWNSSVSHYLTGIGGGATTNLVANGATSFPNNDYVMFTTSFYALIGTFMSVGFTDPTNTPNDHVTVSFEMLA